MNDRPGLAEAATEELEAAPLAPIPATAEVRARTIAAMTEAFLRQRRARRRQRVGVGIAAAAAVVVGIFVGRRVVTTPKTNAVAVASSGELASTSATAAPTASAASVDGTVTVASPGKPAHPLGLGESWGVGDRLHADGDAHALLALSTGTHVELFARSDLALASLAGREVFDLQAGSARFDVAKLHPGERFLVDTPDAEIEVRGTSFTLSIVPPDPECGSGSRTRLVVREGVVWVRSGTTEVRVLAGESWPCAPKAAAPTPSVAISPSISPSGSTTASTNGKAPSLAPTTSATVASPASDLAAQNELFERAMAEKKSGNRAAALADLELFLARHPSSTLAENVEVERMRLLGGAAAAKAAKEYLARHPNGFAREEAEAIAGAASP